jgi:glycosyltransferase involved in cell wall biosynthesis
VNATRRGWPYVHSDPPSPVSAAAAEVDESAEALDAVSADPLRIAILAPVWFPVPPTGYGGIEWIVSLLADGLADAGHDVTLFASGDSRTKAKLEAAFAEAPTEWIGQAYWDLRHALHCLIHSGEFDVVNDHSGMFALALGGLVSTPFVHTVHGPLSGEPGQMYDEIMRLHPGARLISLSMSQRRPKPDLPWIANCPNALDFSVYPVQAHRGEYLLFLGRMTPEKGCHRAIAIAMELGLPLKMAGKMREPRELEYFRELVEPHLGHGIEYLGEVPHGQKVELLQHARATLFPIDWDEPFGLVMIESMACGTPVIATRRGAVPEVIEDGVTGIIVDNYREMATALAEADQLEPLEIRHRAEQRFAPERMVDDYLDAYRRLISGDVPGPAEDLPAEAAGIAEP